MSRRTGPTAAVREIVAARSSGRCEVCLGMTATQIHHRRPRGLGGTRDPRVNGPSNLLHVCLDCHTYIERNRSEALIAGWLVSRWSAPADVAVLIDRGSRYVYLGETYEDAPVGVA